MPILGTPALSFSLSGARRSGWLAPTMGFGAKGKAEVMVPYYFNIAPNRDLTVFPRLMLDRGLSNRDIAAELDISEHTVKVHLWRLFRRLGVKSRTQTLHYARTHGLLMG